MKFFLQNKELTDPAIIINNCLKFLLNRITDDLEREGYSWNKPWGVKRFESIVLSKFILDYAFDGIVEGKLSDDEKNGFYELSNASMSNLFNEEFSEVGMNFEDMQEEIEEKIEGYITARREYRRPPECYYQIYMLITKSKPREELEGELKKKTAGLQFMSTNKNFVSMIPQVEAQISQLKEKVEAFDLADIMLPHMFRSARQKLRNINLKKIKTLSKKIAKQDTQK